MFVFIIYFRNITGTQEDFENKMKAVARKVVKHEEIDDLGTALGFEPEDIERYVHTNMKGPDVSYMGTLSMLRYWEKGQKKATKFEALKDVLEKVGLTLLAEDLFVTSCFSVEDCIVP